MHDITGIRRSCVQYDRREGGDARRVKWPDLAIIWRVAGGVSVCVCPGEGRVRRQKGEAGVSGGRGEANGGKPF